MLGSSLRGLSVAVLNTPDAGVFSPVPEAWQAYVIILEVRDSYSRPERMEGTLDSACNNGYFGLGSHFIAAVSVLSDLAGTGVRTTFVFQLLHREITGYGEVNIYIDHI